MSQPAAGSKIPDRACFCEECGARVSINSRFCDQCGSRVGDKSAAGIAATSVNTPSAAETKPQLASTQPSEASKTQDHGRVAQGLSGTGLGLLLLSLLLPWLQVSCGAVRVDIEGHHLLLGTAHEKFGSLSPYQANTRNTSNQESPNLYLILWAALLILGGLVGAASPRSDGKTATLVAAGLGAVFLLIFYYSTNEDIQKGMAQTMGMVTFQWSSGFWLGVVATGAVGAGGILGVMDSS